MENNNLPVNELGFLYKKCKKIRPWVISELALVSEYMEAIKSFTGVIDDDVVYSIVCREYKAMLADGSDYRTARDVINKISKDVTGSSFSWQEK